MSVSKGPDGVHGLSPDEWQRSLIEALDGSDHKELEKLLAGLGAEMREEAISLARASQAPLVDRLVEQARRIVRSDPTHGESLETELARERKLWADFRQKYRQTFIPRDLRPFLRSSGVFLSPSSTEPRFEGFDKFYGCSKGAVHEAVTLYSRRDTDPSSEGAVLTPPNFFCLFDPRASRFTVLRAYRTHLPRGAGQKCLFEQLVSLVDPPGDLKAFTFDKVQNTATYRVFVTTRKDSTLVRDDPCPEDAPLVRLGRRLIRAIGRTPGPVSVTLDPFGFLDLIITVS